MENKHITEINKENMVFHKIISDNGALDIKALTKSLEVMNDELTKQDQAKLETYDQEMMMQQIIGFDYGRSGASVISLIESAGLEKNEWQEIKEQAKNYLTHNEYVEIENHFH